MSKSDRYLKCVMCSSKIDRNRSYYLALRKHPGLGYCAKCVKSDKQHGDPTALTL